eukprot:CAMPEP_0203636360 /NCGR_PEP_ID=MMETSP0088-20131115/2914_1 /ASSEMBLY_ACC=CAM_ASM_001087 /TAXON_ID=426623 /ORGANISM="Chaetoceros affinis, Strain CCMP159" /LENGTH=241 /DNA_ID=CAMNT_0050490471 /DNA_START=62 /DNA_END=787 /DNA_ORIENTATION=-
MNLAEPAPEVEAATADAAVAPESVYNDNEYLVAPAPDVSSESLDVETYKVAPAVMVDDPRRFAPNDKLNEPYRNPELDVPVEKLRTGSTGITFESQAGISRGIQMTCTRQCLPFLYDERDFVSYGEISRYIVLKDTFCFVYGEQTDPNPLYIVPIDSLNAVVEDPKKPHKRSITVSPMANTNLQGDTLETVLLLDVRGSLAYQFTFDTTDDEDVSKRFVEAVGLANSIGKANDKGTEKTEP